MSLSTHVLDSVTGLPAIGVAVLLEHLVGDDWQHGSADTTNSDGRIGSLGEVEAGRHRITFDTGGYFRSRGVDTFYPQVIVVFDVTDAEQHHHVPLLLSPFAYTTYRGS
jgi:5-hydroxyisourate hydrolase